MKAIFNFSIALFLVAFSANASSAGDAYQQAMQATLEQLDSAESISDYQDVSNKFQRIASAEQDEWLPYYYAGLTQVYMSFQKGLDSDQRDEILEEAKTMASKADDLSPDNVEILILEGYINMAKLSVNPAIRGMLLTPKVNAQFGKAMEMDPENPRAAAMLARMKYGTAQFFNSSTEESCKLAHRSLTLYGAEEAEERGILPSWGKGIAQGLVKACDKP
jgi:hypothetical protein